MLQLRALLVPVLLGLAIAGAIRLLKSSLDTDTNFDWSEVPPWPVFSAGMAAARGLPVLQSAVAPPHVLLVNVASGMIHSKALHAAAELGIADALAAGPLPVEEIAKAKGLDAERLSRVLRLLTTLGIFRQPHPGVFANNRASGALRAGHPSSARDLVRFLGSASYMGFLKFHESLAAGHHGISVREVTGMGAWEWLDLPDNRPHLETFDRAMTEISRWNVPPLLQDYDWSQHANKTLADIGGGLGRMLSAVLEQQPSMQGILFDRPFQIERARALWAADHPALLARAEFVAGNFLEAAPAADVYFAQHILHDWDAAHCRTLLRSVRSAARPGAALLISDIVMEEGNPGPFKAALDLNMMALPGGKERTAAQWHALLDSAGWALETVVPLRSLDGLIVASPKAS